MKKVLLITYYWPPAGGPGVQRIVKYVKAMPDFGWEPIVLTVKNPSSPTTDQSLLKEIPDNCQIYKTNTYEPFNLYKSFTGKEKGTHLSKDVIIKKPGESFIEKIARSIRANLFIPDARLAWNPYLVKAGRRIIDEEKPRVIMSTSPPHSLQLGARKLARVSGLKWIADFRDPWIEAYWESELKRLSLANFLNRTLEKKILEAADAITTVSDGLCELFKTKADNSFNTIYHGFGSLNSEIIKSEAFNIVYFGNMSKYQTPGPVIDAIEKLPTGIQNKIVLIFIGRIYEKYRTIITRNKHVKVEFYDFMPYQDVMNFSKSASLLLAVHPTSVYGSGYMAAKTYDYLSLRKPILALGTKGGELDTMLKDTSSGKVFGPNDIIEISNFINSIFQQWEQKKYILLGHSNQLNRYSLSSNVSKLVALFEKMDEASQLTQKEHT
jgi:hypothetical protein